MKLVDILRKEAIRGELSSSDKKGVLEELASLVNEVYPQLPTDQVLKVLLEREKLGSTGVGNGVAIPHGKMPGLDSIICVFGRSKEGVGFDAHDDRPAHLFFVLLAPENAVGNHLQALARLSRLLKLESTRELLKQVRTEELFDVLITEDAKL